MRDYHVDGNPTKHRGWYYWGEEKLVHYFTTMIK